MTRIFGYFATFAFAFLVLTFALGLMMGDLREQPTQEVLRWKTIHFLFGLVSALLVMLANGVAVTYFIGTSRWCKEVSETYSLDTEYIRRSTRNKRRAFPWAILSMLTMVAVAALGAAADPHNTLVRQTQNWAMPHFLAGTAGVALVGLSFFFQLPLLKAQHEVIGNILDDVKRIRGERGLSP